MKPTCSVSPWHAGLTGPSPALWSDETDEKWGSNHIGDACRSVGKHELDAGHACGQECAKRTHSISGTRMQGGKGDFVFEYDHMSLRKA